MELFHYTRVETLELILKSKKLRFRSLLDVDDSEEKFTSDMYDYAKHCFVSCFTANSQESLPIWEMYCKSKAGEGGHGIRLKFTGNIFNEVRLVYPVKDYFVVISGNGQPYQVIYTNDADKIYPKVEKIIDGKIYHDVTKLAIYKRQEWEFQNEWRYKLLVYRGEYIDNNLMVALHNIPISLYDVEIDSEVLNSIEVMIGYKVSLEDRKRIEHWVSEFNEQNNGNIKITNSFFTNIIK